MQADTPKKKRKLCLMAAFSFVNGWVDAVCISRYHCFATMMVGNMLTLGNSVQRYWVPTPYDAERPWLPDPLFYLLLLGCFMFGVSLYRVLERGFGWSAKHFAPFAVLWIVLHDAFEQLGGNVESEGSISRWSVLGLAPVFGIQDALCVKNGFGSLPWCTTNNVVTIAFAAADVLLGGATLEEKTKLLASAVMMLFMVLGAISGSMFDVWAIALERWLDVDYGLEDYDIAFIAPFLGVLFWFTDNLFAKPAQLPTPIDEAPLLSEWTAPWQRQHSTFGRPMHPVESTLQLAGVGGWIEDHSSSEQVPGRG